jgi:hypothetical protein
MVNSVTLNAYSYDGLLGNHSKLYVPVSPAAVIYSQFDHISGVAAHSNQTGIPVSKIRILNTLIDQLMSMKSQPKTQQELPAMTDEQMDMLIKDYQGQIQSAVSLAESTGYGLAGAEPQAGALFSIPG